MSPASQRICSTPDTGNLVLGLFKSEAINKLEFCKYVWKQPEGSSYLRDLANPYVGQLKSSCATARSLRECFGCSGKLIGYMRMKISHSKISGDHD